METVVGIFTTRAKAEKALKNLRAAGAPDDRINLLTPGNVEEKLDDVPTIEAEQPGMGTAVGGVVGGALGAAGGMTLGAAAATVLVPGVGPVFALGLLGAALFGAGGTVGGMALGEAMEENLTKGIAADELYLYEDALRQGRSVVIVFADGGGEAETFRRLMEEAGAESIDAARESWWLGLRDVEKEHYTSEGRDFEGDEPAYRRGFEAALYRQTRGKGYEEAGNALAERYPDAYKQESFRRGYERGRSYHRRLTEKYKTSRPE